MLSELYAITRPSICHTGGSCKNDEVRIMKFSPNGSPVPLVFAGEVSSRNSKGFPRAAVSNEGWVSLTWG